MQCLHLGIRMPVRSENRQSIFILLKIMFAKPIYFFLFGFLIKTRDRIFHKISCEITSAKIQKFKGSKRLYHTSLPTNGNTFFILLGIPHMLCYFGKTII